MQPADVPARTSTLALEEYTAEKPVLSSAQSPWSTLLVRTYEEPDEFRVQLPAVPDPLIIVQYSGADSKLERKMRAKRSAPGSAGAASGSFPAKKAPGGTGRTRPPKRLPPYTCT